MTSGGPTVFIQEVRAWPWAFGLIIAAACAESPAPDLRDTGQADLDAAGALDASTDAGSVQLDGGPDADTIADAAAMLDGAELGDAAPSDTGPTMDAAQSDAAPSDAGPSAGSFSLLTYNVAGLPDVISGSNPSVNTPLISPLLNAYDVVVVQEDFAYHDDLIAQVTHPYLSAPNNPPGVNMGDGLNHLSIHPFTDYFREAWVECNGIIDEGSDCLTDKGFSVARLEPSPGVTIDLYDVHFDAGRAQADSDARVAQIAQLITAIMSRPAARALIIAGDTNLKEEDEAVLLDLLTTLGLTDACRLEACPDPGHHDRVMAKSGPDLTLVLSNWRLDPTFVDSAGADLSDHPAVAVDIAWSAF